MYDGREGLSRFYMAIHNANAQCAMNEARCDARCDHNHFGRYFIWHCHI